MKVGDTFDINVLTKNVLGTLIDPDSLVITVRAPDYTETPYTYPARLGATVFPVRLSVGTFRLRIVVYHAGEHKVLTQQTTSGICISGTSLFYVDELWA
jgi:hypothetical protein